VRAGAAPSLALGRRPPLLPQGTISPADCLGMPAVGFLARVTCKQCGASALTENGHAMDAALSCGCCTKRHDHAKAANACPGARWNHKGTPCPHPDGECQHWESVRKAARAHVRASLPGLPDFGHPRLATSYDHEAPCPGEHCGLGVKDCTACRPVVVDILSPGGGMTPVVPEPPRGPQQPPRHGKGAPGLGIAPALGFIARLCWAFFVLRFTLLATSMTDRNRVAALAQAIFVSSTSFTITPGTGGGSAFTITPPYKFRLMTAAGSNTANGTEATGSNCPGYTAGGQSMGATGWSYSAGIISNANALPWTATGAWSAIVGGEAWDSAGTPLRWLQGPITSFTLANGNTVNFAVAAITGDLTAW
jgi:hypothetical protein